MLNHYKTLNVKSNSSNWKLLKSFESKLRDKNTINKKEIIHAYLITGQQQPRKFYNLLYSHKIALDSKTGLKYINALSKFEKQAEELSSNSLLNKTLEQNSFWEYAWLRLIMRITGLHIVFAIEFDRNVSPIMRLLGVGYFFLHYGIPILLGMANPLFFLLIPLIAFLVSIREYRFLKKEYYEIKIFKNDLSSNLGLFDTSKI